MNQQDFSKLVEATVKATADILIVKGGEYAGSEDRLANFKRGAQLTGCTPLQVALIYLSKHYDSVCTYIRDEANGVQRPRSEPMSGRLHDIINYALLIEALIVENEQAKARGPLETAVHGALRIGETGEGYQGGLKR